MDWRVILGRTELIAGLISLGLIAWGGVHLQHLLDDGGGRHVGEVLVFFVLGLALFVASQYRARRRGN